MSEGPDDTVYRVPASCGSWEGQERLTGTNPKAYHTDPECRHLARRGTGRVIEESRATAERRGLECCKRCSGEYDQSAVEQSAECPFCGEPVGKLPAHLRSGTCGGRTDA